MRTVTGPLLVPPGGSPALPAAPQAASAATDPPPASAAAPHSARRVVLCILVIPTIQIRLLGRSDLFRGSGSTLVAFTSHETASSHMPRRLRRATRSPRRTILPRANTA